jgi:hypothetical protein
LDHRLLDRLFQPIVDLCPGRLRHLPAIIGLFPLVAVCMVLFVALFSLLADQEAAAQQILTWVMVVAGNTAMITLGVLLAQAQERGTDRFRLTGAFVRYPLLLAAGCFTVISPGRAVAILWLWWAAASFMGCKAR